MVGHVNEMSRAEALLLKDSGLRAVSTDCPPNLPDAAFLGWVKRAVPAAKLAARSVLIYRIGSLQQAMMAAAIGATHAEVIG